MMTGRILNASLRRFATASALAASSVPALLFARGHRIGNVTEVPLVVHSKTFEDAAFTKTKAAIALLILLRSRSQENSVPVRVR
jgi:large subunit ribosomal protein L4e